MSGKHITQLMESPIVAAINIIERSKGEAVIKDRQSAENKKA